MKIMAPVNSMKSALLQFAAGADEIYMGLSQADLNNFSFTGRGKKSNKGISAHIDESDFKKIVDKAHNQRILVNYTANTQIMSEGINNSYQEAYYQYICRGIRNNVDAVIVGDIGNLYFLNQKKITVPIIGSTFYSVFNKEAVLFFKDLGVKRVIFPHHMLLQEITEICKEVDIEIEVFVGMGCSNIEGSCHLIHNCGESIQLGLPCKALYKVTTGDNYSQYVSFIDATLDCALCQLSSLMSSGVDVVKIVGRSQNPVFIASIVKIYKDCINWIKENGPLTGEKRNELIKNAPWWKRDFCDKNRCKYGSNEIINSFV